MDIDHAGDVTSSHTSCAARDLDKQNGCKITNSAAGSAGFKRFVCLGVEVP